VNVIVPVAVEVGDSKPAAVVIEFYCVPQVR
jgi:hypothetical protein